MLYGSGLHGVVQSWPTAVGMWRKAAESSYPDAKQSEEGGKVEGQLILGKCYLYDWDGGAIQVESSGPIPP